MESIINQFILKCLEIKIGLHCSSKINEFCHLFLDLILARHIVASESSLAIPRSSHGHGSFHTRIHFFQHWRGFFDVQTAFDAFVHFAAIYKNDSFNRRPMKTEAVKVEKEKSEAEKSRLKGPKAKKNHTGKTGTLESRGQRVRVQKILGRKV